MTAPLSGRPSLTQNLSLGIQNNFATVDTGLLYVLLVWEQQQIKKNILPGQITAVIIKFSFYYQFASGFRQ